MHSRFSRTSNFGTNFSGIETNHIFLSRNTASFFSRGFSFFFYGLFFLVFGLVKLGTDMAQSKMITSKRPLKIGSKTIALDVTQAKLSILLPPREYTSDFYYYSEQFFFVFGLAREFPAPIFCENDRIPAPRTYPAAPKILTLHPLGRLSKFRN